MYKMLKCAVWVAIFAVALARVENILQSTLVGVGIMSRQYTMKDVCKAQDWPDWFIDALGCEKQENFVKNPPESPVKAKIRIGKTGNPNLSRLFKKKSLLDHVYYVINRGLAWVQRLILPEGFVLPCLFGDCDMDKDIRRQKDILLYKDKKKNGQ